MYLIFGLGNPGREYAGTRHNIGFEVISLLAKRQDIKIKASKFDAYAGEDFFAGQKVILAMPTSYMNLSGQVVKKFVRFYKMPEEELPQKLIVIYDDTDLALGQIRIRERGSAGGHNGMKNILYMLETDEFIRVRVGVGKRPEGWSQSNYVLARFSKSEEDAAVRGIIAAADAVEDILRHGVNYAMNKYNTNPEKPASRVKYHCYETDAEFVYCVEGAEGKIYKALEADMYWTKTDDGKFVKIYPTNTGFEDAWYLDASYKQVISDNFSRYGQSFIAQNFNWERVLKFIAEKFLDSGIKWYLTGSVTRAVSDADVKPKDIDIIVHTDDFYKVKELFKEYTIEPFVDNKGSWVIRYFGKLLIRGACVDIAADEKMDAKISQSAYEKVDWNGHEIFVIEI